ncbi:hypothetical protein L9F63_017817, partial [Diploptera punctata]
ATSDVMLFECSANILPNSIYNATINNSELIFISRQFNVPSVYLCYMLTGTTLLFFSVTSAVGCANSPPATSY